MDPPHSPLGGLTDVPGLLVGHATDEAGLTGVTTVLCPGGAVAGAALRGGASGVLGLDLLDPGHVVERIHGVVLAGGSAFGLEAVFGAMAHLEAAGIGLSTSAAIVPLVVGAILYDLGIGSAAARPDRAMGRRAAAAATAGAIAEGSVGAGTGATVGKLFGLTRAMKGGIGTASRRVGTVTVGALVAVNAVGDVRDPASGALVAGARLTADGHGLADTARIIRQGGVRLGLGPTNTTIGVVATGAALTKPEAARLAALAHGGLTVALSPAHLSVDGDTLFALATGRGGGAQPGLDALGLAGSDAVAEAVLRAIRAATSLAGSPPSWRELFGAPTG